MRLISTTTLVVALALAVSTPDVYAQRRSQDPRALTDAGVAALKDGRFGDALDAFTQASKLVPADPNLTFAAGVAAFRLGHFDDAETWFMKTLKLDPRSTDVSQWLGETQHQEGHVKDAIATYEAALKRDPNAHDIETRLGEWRREGQIEDRFYESRGAHFSVRFEGPADDALARRVVERLEAAYWRIGAALTAYPQQPITVVLYTTEQFRDITRSPTWAGGSYDGRIHVPIRGAADQSEDLDRILGHEFVHAVVAMIGGRAVPAWLNEGLAVAFEPGGREGAEKVLARNSARPLLKTLHNGYGRLSSTDATVAYALGASAVGRMIDLRGAPAIVALLQDLREGTPFATAFQQRIFMSYDDFQAMVAR